VNLTSQKKGSFQRFLLLLLLFFKNKSDMTGSMFTESPGSHKNAQLDELETPVKDSINCPDR
jgi:hypothetical protein